SMKEAEGLPRLKALVKNWLGWDYRGGRPGGWAVADSMCECDDIEDPVRNKILEMETEWRDLLTKTVREASSLGHLRADLDAAQFVGDLHAIYLAPPAAQRFLKSPDADQRAQTAFEALLERAAPVP